MRRLSLGLFLIAAASSLLLISDWKQRRAPTGHLPRVAIVQHASQGIIDEGVRGIADALAENGFVDQKTVLIQRYNAESDIATANAIAKEVTSGQFDLILTATTVSLQSVANANQAGKVKHVFGLVSDPFGAGVGISGNFPPSFVTQPSSTGGFAGSTVQLSATASGTPPITNQWTFNGTNILDGGQFLGARSNVLTIFNVGQANAGVYNLVLSNSVTSLVSSNATLEILTKTLVGEWLRGTQTFADVSGYTPNGRHDAFVHSGGTTWDTDVPPVAPPGSYSLNFNNAGLEVSNSATVDASYKSTFDSTINSGMTVMCWAKGFPGAWNPWVSKLGEALAWQLRINNAGPNSCWSIRGTGGTEDMTSSFGSNDGNWHHYAGTYNATTGIRTLYVDGKLAVTQSGQGPYTLSAFSHLMIGARDNGGNTFDNSVAGFGNYFTGKIYDVRVYDYALSQLQIGAAVPGLPPILASQVIPGSGGNPGQFVLSWSGGTLLEATNVAGPWNTNAVQTSPVTNVMTMPADFFKVKQ